MLGELTDHRDVLVPPEGDRLIIDPIYSGDGDEEDHQIEQNCGEFDDHIDDDDAEDRGDDACVAHLKIAFSWNFGRKASGNPNLGWMSAYLEDKIIHVVHILNQETKVNLNHKIV